MIRVRLLFILIAMFVCSIIIGLVGAIVIVATTHGDVVQLCPCPEP